MDVKVESYCKRRPKVIVYDVDRNITGEEVHSLLREQNFEDVSATDFDFKVS